AYRSFWGADPEIRRTTDPVPERPTIDLNAMPILSEQMPARRLPGAPDPRAVQVAARMMPIVAESSHVTLAAIRILDRQGRVVIGRDDVGASYAELPEVRAALSGQTTTVLRRRGNYQ